MTARILVVDHKDSFVFILGEQFARLGAAVDTLRCDVDLDRFTQRLEETSPDLVVLSPGPGHPKNSGVTVPWLRTRPQVPTLGICLGHQAMAFAAGGEVDRGPRPVHGKASRVTFHPSARTSPIGLHKGLPDRFPVARYHSLVVTRAPEDCEVLATTSDQGQHLIMAMAHRQLPWIGMQFHPESVLTPWGGRLIANILLWAQTHSSPSTRTSAP